MLANVAVKEMGESSMVDGKEGMKKEAIKGATNALRC